MISTFQDETCGNILLSLRYVPHASEVRGIILKATNLKKQDITGFAGKTTPDTLSTLT